MSLKLYWMPISQPARCVAWALEYAGVEYESVNVMPGAHDVLLRAAR
jgi:glutathione S-transferase